MFSGRLLEVVASGPKGARDLRTIIGDPIISRRSLGSAMETGISIVLFPLSWLCVEPVGISASRGCRCPHRATRSLRGDINESGVKPG